MIGGSKSIRTAASFRAIGNTAANTDTYTARSASKPIPARRCTINKIIAEGSFHRSPF